MAPLPLPDFHVSSSVPLLSTKTGGCSGNRINFVSHVAARGTSAFLTCRHAARGWCSGLSPSVTVAIRQDVSEQGCVYCHSRNTGPILEMLSRVQLRKVTKPTASSRTPKACSLPCASRHRCWMHGTSALPRAEKCESTLARVSISLALTRCY